VALRLTNDGARPLELRLLGREAAFDIVVSGEDGRTVWRRLAGAVLPMALQLRVLAPGETLELAGAWPQRRDDGAPAAPGSYTVRGEIPTDAPEPMRTAAVRVVVAPPEGP
jgi:hypothetical protein